MSSDTFLLEPAKSVLFQVRESVVKYSANYPMSNYVAYKKNGIKIDFASI